MKLSKFTLTAQDLKGKLIKGKIVKIYTLGESGLIYPSLWFLVLWVYTLKFCHKYIHTWPILLWSYHTCWFSSLIYHTCSFLSLICHTTLKMYWKYTHIAVLAMRVSHLCFYHGFTMVSCCWVFFGVGPSPHQQIQVLILRPPDGFDPNQVHGTSS